MDPRPPGGSLNNKSCQNVPSEIPSAENFCRPQFPQHQLFSHPSYAMNFPFPQFPHYPMYSPNFQYGVVQPHFAPYSLPPQPCPPTGVMPSPCPPARIMPSSPLSDPHTPHSVTGPGEQDIASMDNDENAERTARRLAWMEKEDIRLINVWLNNFNKSQKYWQNIEVTYNSATPSARRREMKQLKDRWQNIKRKIAQFDACWSRVKAKHPTGMSDNMQLMDKTWMMYNDEARTMYLEETKHNFSLDHCWKVVWNQPKWKDCLSSLSTKRAKQSESWGCMSSSEDSDDESDKEIGQQGCMTSKEKLKCKLNVSSSSAEVQEDIQCSVDPQNILTKNAKDNCKEITEVQFHLPAQKLELSRVKQLETDDKETTTFKKQPESMMVDTSLFNEFHHRKDQLISGISKLNECQHGRVVREDMAERETQRQGRTPKHEKILMEDINEKAIGLRGCEAVEHKTAASIDIPEKDKRPQGCNVPKVNRKRKGKASSSSFEVQEDIKRAVRLQTMLNKDREKMSEVQLRLSSEMLELARIKQKEAQDKKETTLYKKYTELLMADTSKFDEFQKAEYEKAVRRMGGMLFGNDAN